MKKVTIPMMERFGILLFVDISWLILFLCGRHNASSELCYHVQIIASVSWLSLDTWVIEGINPLNLLSTPERKSEWPTGTIIEQLIWDLSKSLIVHTPQVPTPDGHQSVTMCHKVPEARLFRVFPCVRVDMLKDKKLQNLPEPVKSALGRAGRVQCARARAAAAGADAYYAIQTFLLRARPSLWGGRRTRHRHCPSTAMSKFFLSIFSKIEIPRGSVNEY